MMTDPTPDCLLNPLAPHGLGTGAVESFRGYLCRLALSHFVSPDTLVRSVEPRLRRHSPSCPGRRLKANWRNDEVGLAKVIAPLTGQPLENLTLTPWSHLIAPTSLRRRHLVWCPGCLAQSKAPYERLAWTLQAVRCCPAHGASLLDRCASCGRPIDRTPWVLIWWRCPYCRADLVEAPPGPPADETGLAFARLCAGLLVDRRQPMATEKVRDLIAAALTKAACPSMRVAADEIGVRESTLWNLLTSASHAPRLEIWCRLALWIGTDLPTLLGGAIPDAPHARVVLVDPDRSAVPLKRSRAARLAEIRAGLDSLKGEDPSQLSMRKITRRLRASHPTLRGHFAREVVALVARHRAWRQEAFERSRQRLESEITAAHDQLLASGIYPTWYAVRQVLGMTCRSGSPAARQIVLSLQHFRRPRSVVAAHTPNNPEPKGIYTHENT